MKLYPNSIWEYELKDEFKIADITLKGGIFQKNKQLKLSYREREVAGYRLDNDKDPVCKNLMGMRNLVSHLSAQDPEIQNLLIQKIQTINSEFTIQANDKAQKEWLSIVKLLANVADAFIFANGNTPIAASDTQHFLDSNLNLILDMEGLSQISHLDVKIDSKYFDQDPKTVISEQNERKQRSEELLQQKGIKINQNLPTINCADDVIIRSPEEIAERLVALALTNLVAFSNISGEQAIAYAKKNNIEHFLTSNEVTFLSNPTPERKSHETWKCEGIWTLSWALNHVTELPFPNTLVDLARIPEERYPIGSGVTPSAFIRSIEQARSKAEILDANDLYYRMNWACVDMRIKDEPMEIVHPGVVYERHYALNWLINYQDQSWDEITTDT